MSKDATLNSIPLPEKIRPKKLTEFVGQEHLVGPPSRKASEGQGIISLLLKNAVKTGFFPSLIFWGPPGSGKTTLARIIASQLKREFFEFSAVNTKTSEIEKITKEQKNLRTKELKKQLVFGENKKHGLPSTAPKSPVTSHQSPIIFIDEIHRFNKAQQDKLLPHVEKGKIILIGATTENPSFEVIGPLLSRCRVVTLNQLSEKELEKILKSGLKELKVRINTKAKKFLIESSNGDARVLLNVLEIASNLSSSHRHPRGGVAPAAHLGGVISIRHIEQALQRRQLSFDKQGEEYYNVISAFIKSMRASDVDASLYYLARMVEAGQDPLYIARRMVVFASEDVASPTALVVANAVFQACQQIGYPECQENLAHGVVYLATAKKDRSAYDAYMAALDDVRKFGNLPIPMKIRNAPTKLMKNLGYGKGYKMYDKESLLPKKIKRKI